MLYNNTYPIPTEIASKKVFEEPNFVALKRYGYSLFKLEERYEECPDHVIAQALLIDEKDVDVIYQRIVAKLRNLMGIET